MFEPNTIEKAYKVLQDFFRDKPLVLFGTGTSCAVDNRFGISELKIQLLNRINKKIKLDKTQKQEWRAVVAAVNNDNNFEIALGNAKDPRLLTIINQEIGRFISILDKEYSKKIVSGEKEWPATDLFKKLVLGLPKADPALHVITPNYDLLAEYAFERAKLPYINGFVGGVSRHLDWDLSARTIMYCERAVQRRRSYFALKSKKHIRLYKVHGSINTFLVQDQIIENNAWTWEPPEGIERIIIVPGNAKYKKLHHHREPLLHKADEAISEENRFLFLGYGFNDDQLEGKISEKLIQQKCQALIITRDSNARIDHLVSEAENLWLVCKPQGREGTSIRNRNFQEVFIPDRNLWDFYQFTQEILGE